VIASGFSATYEVKKVQSLGAGLLVKKLYTRINLPSLVCYVQKKSSPEVIAGHLMQGRLFETFIVMEIIKLIQQLPIQPNLYHFRSHSGAEVDLILELNGVLYPIEIKAKSNPNRRDKSGILYPSDLWENQ